MKKGFVCVLDVLGFKHLSDDQMVSVVNTLEHTYSKVMPTVLKERIGTEKRLEDPVALLFQDTIIIAFPLTSELRIAQTVFYAMHDCLGILFCALLAEGIKLRGAIGYGTIHTTEHGVFGGAAYDAASEYEDVEWAGIHYTVAAGAQFVNWFHWAEKNNVDFSPLAAATRHPEFRLQVYPVAIPFSKVRSEHGIRMTVPWPKDHRWVFSAEGILSNDQRTVSTLVHGVLAPDLDSSDDRIRKKIQNTLSYFDSYREKYPDINHRLIWKGPLPPFE